MFRNISENKDQETLRESLGTFRHQAITLRTGGLVLYATRGQVKVHCDQGWDNDATWDMFQIIVLYQAIPHNSPVFKTHIVAILKDCGALTALRLQAARSRSIFVPVATCSKLLSLRQEEGTESQEERGGTA